MRLEILLTAVVFFGGSFLTGYAVQRILKLKNDGIFFSVISGVICWWALMELILVPMTFQLAAFHMFVYVYSVVILASMVMGICCWKDIKKDLTVFFKDMGQYFTMGHIVALVLILFQLYFIHHHMYLEWDDAYYVNLANEAVNSDKIYWVYPETGSFADFDKRYVLSLWPIFYAWLSRMSGVIPTVMAHTIFPWLMIPLTYMVYALIGKRLFAEDGQMQGMFLTFAVMMHLFMGGQHTAGLTFLSITPWVGKGVLAVILFPVLFYCILRTTEEDTASNWILLGLAGFGGCLLSSMGIMLTPVFVGTAVFLLALQKRSLRYLLHGLLSCTPCIVLGLCYIILTH